MTFRRLRRLMEHPAHRRCFATLGALTVALTTWSISRGGGSGGLAWVVGLLAWTPTEYLLHRFLFHVPQQHPLASLGAKHHHAHHEHPSEPPITKPLFLTLPPLGILIAAGAWLGDAAFCGAVGFLAGYLGYELCHVSAHWLGAAHPHPRLRDAHLRHHAFQTRNFGITSRAWDRLLGTMETPLTKRDGPRCASCLAGPRKSSRAR